MLAQIPAFFGGFFSNYQCPFQKAIVLNIAFEKNRKITQQKVFGTCLTVSTKNYSH